MARKLMIAVSPHIKSATTTRKIMLDVVIALMPAAVAAVLFFGLDALRVILTSVLQYDVQCPEAEVISDLAAMRQAEMAESRELSRARNNDNMEEIDSEEVENYQFDIPSEEINANTEAK